MITTRKLASLPEGTRERKLYRVLASVIREPELVSAAYTAELLRIISTEDRFPPEVRRGAGKARERCSVGVVEQGMEAMRHELLKVLLEMEQFLGEESAEWDLSPRQGSAGARPLSDVSVYVELVRSPFNLGSIVRTAAAFGIRSVLLSPGVPHEHPRFFRSAMGAEEAVTVVSDAPLPESRPGRPVVALETGGDPVAGFHFPPSAVVLVGSEELGLSPAALKAADARVSIPLSGPKVSLNVAVALGALLSWWSAAFTTNSRSD